MSDSEYFEKIQDSIAKALQVEMDEIEVDSKLIDDLGAESIDFLDIVFRLEKTFNIKIPRDDLFPEKVLTDAQYVQSGRITADGLNILKEKLPTIDLSGFEKEPLVAKLPDLFTVKMIVDYIERRMKSSS
ncbi:MAG: acyl carrier protein [Candidatus Omnitrophota bacterium]|jgi:acyl carrier protein